MWKTKLFLNNTACVNYVFSFRFVCMDNRGESPEIDF